MYCRAVFHIARYASLTHRTCFFMGHNHRMQKSLFSWFRCVCLPCTSHTHEHPMTLCCSRHQYVQGQLCLLYVCSAKLGHIHRCRVPCYFCLFYVTFLFKASICFFSGAIVSSTCTSCVAGTYSSLSGVKYLVARIKSLLSFSVAPYWQRATHRTGYAYSIRRYIASLIVGIQACSGPAVWLHVKDEILFCSVVTDHSRKLASADLILTAPTVAQVKPMSLRVSCAILEHIHRDLVRLISSVWLKKKSLIFLNRKWQCQHLYRLRCRNILERPWSLFDMIFISVGTNVMQAMQVQ